MADQDARESLARLVRERGEDYASLSRLIGRNPAYIQQFIGRGTPRKLDEGDRRILAAYFAVDESLLGGPAAPRIASARRPASRRDADLVRVPRLDLRASAGPGAIPGGERAHATVTFDQRWLRSVAGGTVAGLSTIRVTGDSMEPTLAEGDEILVDTADGADRLRDGIYVLRRDEELFVKRIALDPAGRGITVRSDNALYPAWPGCARDSIAWIGRVVWVGRRIL